VRVVLIMLTLLLPTSVLAQSNVYGPGISSDATGRPFSWQPVPGNGAPDPLSHVRPDAYAPGIGMDQYGRPVQPAPLSPGDQPNTYAPQRGSPSDNFGAIAFSTSSGAIGYSYNYRSGNDAQESALQTCGNNCKVVVWFTNACGALAVGADRRYGTGWAGNRQEAESTAMRYCSSNTTGCGIARWTCTTR
jgi:hypothetical protein